MKSVFSIFSGKSKTTFNRNLFSNIFCLYHVKNFTMDKDNIVFQINMKYCILLRLQSLYPPSSSAEVSGRCIIMASLSRHYFLFFRELHLVHQKLTAEYLGCWYDVSSSRQHFSAGYQFQTFEKGGGGFEFFKLISFLYYFYYHHNIFLGGGGGLSCKV